MLVLNYCCFIKLFLNFIFLFFNDYLYNILLFYLFIFYIYNLYFPYYNIILFCVSGFWTMCILEDTYVLEDTQVH